jgi:DNA-binding NtrC family response regulator
VAKGTGLGLSVSDVEAAVEIVNPTAEIVLIITDIMIPQKPGTDVIHMVETKRGQQIKFIVMSGHASPRVEGNGVDIAPYPYLKKPSHIEQLINTAASVLTAKE